MSFFKEARFTDTDLDGSNPDPESNQGQLHEDFDQLDEMLMAQGGKVPHFRQITGPVKILCVKKANIIRGCRISWGTPFTPGFSLTHT